MAEFAPKIVKKLPEVVQTLDKQLTKLEVKVVGQPKPTTVWKKANEEIVPSEDFQIENFDDGTSVLIINDVYPDDSGEITFEAHNPLGVASTTTELRVEGKPLFTLTTMLTLQFFCFQVCDWAHVLNRLHKPPLNPRFPIQNYTQTHITGFFIFKTQI